MQLSSLEVTNAQGSVLELPLEDPVNYIIKNIEGLGPVNATLVSSSFANMDGAQYHSSRRETRNIVLTLGLEPDYAISSVQALRDELYKFFMPKTPGTWKFHLFDKFTESVLEQSRDRVIQGRVESCEPSIFTKDPAMDISLVCFDPDFVDPVPASFEGLTLTDITDMSLPYEGTVDTGVIFTLVADHDFEAFTIFHHPPDGSLVTVDFSYPILEGDVVTISSVQGSKYVKLLRAGVESSILYAISPQSGWIRLQPGDNSIRVYATDTPMVYTIDYTTKYGAL